MLQTDVRHSFFSEELLFLVHGLVESIGEEEDGVAIQDFPLAHFKLDPRENPHGQVFVGLEGHPIDERRRMSRIAVSESAGRQVEHSHEECNKHIVLIVGRHGIVHGRYDTVGRRLSGAEHTEHGAGHGHDECGGHPLSTDISHTEEEFLIAYEEVVQVASHLFCRCERGIDIHIAPFRESRKHFGHHGQLNVSCYGEFVFYAFLLGFHLMEMAFAGDGPLDDKCQDPQSEDMYEYDIEERLLLVVVNACSEGRYFAHGHIGTYHPHHTTLRIANCSCKGAHPADTVMAFVGFAPEGITFDTFLIPRALCEVEIDGPVCYLVYVFVFVDIDAMRFFLALSLQAEVNSYNFLAFLQALLHHHANRIDIPRIGEAFHFREQMLDGGFHLGFHLGRISGGVEIPLGHLGNLLRDAPSGDPILHSSGEFDEQSSHNQHHDTAYFCLS